MLTLRVQKLTREIPLPARFSAAHTVDKVGAFVDVSKSTSLGMGLRFLPLLLRASSGLVVSIAFGVIVTGILPSLAFLLAPLAAFPVATGADIADCSVSRVVRNFANQTLPSHSSDHLHVYKDKVACATLPSYTPPQGLCYVHSTVLSDL